MDVLSLIARHGPLLLFAVCFIEAIGLPLPAAIALLGAGALTREGRLPLAGYFAGLAGLLLGDIILYLIGRFTGWYFLGFLCRLSANPESCIYHAAQTFYRRGRIALLFTKFIPGINTMAAPLAGSLLMRPMQFLAFDAAGAILYSGTYFALGYAFSQFLTDIASTIASAGNVVKSVLIGAVSAYLFYRLWMIRKLRAEYFDIPRIHAREASAQLAACPEDTLVLDVRSHGYYGNTAVRIQGAARLEPNRLPEALHELPEAKKIYLYCT
jgi:membrane protein DedA with SNARE-associated domain